MNSQPIVMLRAGEQYGAQVFKPANEAAQTFAAIAKTSTITPATIQRVKALGFRVLVEGNEQLEL